MPVNENGLPNHVARRTEARLPIAVAEHDHRIRVLRCVILRSQQASRRRLEAEQLEIVSADDFSILALRLIVPGHAYGSLVSSQNALKYLVLIAQVQIGRASCRERV